MKFRASAVCPREALPWGGRWNRWIQPFATMVLAVMLAGFGPVPLYAGSEAELAGFAAQDVANPPPEDPILFVGSSSIANWLNLKSWFPGFPVLNRGLGGTQMSDMVNYFNRLVVTYKPSLIVLYQGDNDLASGKTPASVFAQYVTFVNRVNLELPGTNILIISVKPSPSRIAFIGAMRELNSLLRNFCSTRPTLRFADVFTPMLNPGGQPRPEIYGGDLLHLNAAGYSLWQSIVAPFLAVTPFDGRHSFRLDFGNTPTLEPGWNTLSASVGGSADGTLPGLMQVNGQPSTVTLRMVSPFNAAVSGGATNNLMFPASATQDSLSGNTEPVLGKSNIFPHFKLTGLDPARVYRFTFYASQLDRQWNLQTRYSIAGQTISSGLLDPAGNENQVLCLPGVMPDAAGSIAIRLTPGPANNSPVHFTCLSALKVDGLLREVPDLSPPLVLSTVSRLGRIIDITFNKPVDATSIAGSFHFPLTPVGVVIAGASLQPGGRTISLTLAFPVYGPVQLEVDGIKDTAGQALAPGTVVNFQAPPAPLTPLYIDFGADTRPVTGSTATGTWNNLSSSVGLSDTGVMSGLVSGENKITSCDLQMIRRFNGVNSNGTTQSTILPADATADSLFGNSETFSGLANVAPAFRLAGLPAGKGYDLAFYASRTGAADHRETRYTAAGLNTVTTVLEAANNINSVAVAEGVYADANGEITISLEPGPANDNPYHFTYLGSLGLSPARDPEITSARIIPPARIRGSQIRIEWTGRAKLQRADSPAGPWFPVLPVPESPFLEAASNRLRQFYRLAWP